MRQDVEFPGYHGTTLRGWLYLPDDAAAPVPGVVMAHGYSATKEMALDDYAEVISAGGIAVLVYDHAHLGASDGEPRQVLDPWVQTRGYFAALDWLAAHAAIDADRLGVWGSSYTGGHVLIAGAVDERVRAVVANVPFVGSPRAFDGNEEERFVALKAALTGPSDYGREFEAGALIGPMVVADEPGGNPPGTVRTVIHDPDSAEWLFAEAARPGTRWRNEVWVPTTASQPAVFDPGAALAHIHAATLLVAASKDLLVPVEDVEAAYERLPEPKGIVIIEGHHCVPYSGEALIRSAGAARDFYQKHL